MVRILNPLTVILCGILALVSAAPSQESPTGIVGRWEGSLGPPGRALRLVLRIVRAQDGLLLGSLVSVDQGGASSPLDRLEDSNGKVLFEIDSIRGKFEGALSADQRKLTGVWTQGGAMPLEFTRAADTTTDAPPVVTASRSPLDPASFSHMLDLEVPVPPAPVRTRDGLLLAYELHMRNFRGPLLVTGIDLLAGKQTLASWRGAELNAAMMSPAATASGDHRTIGAGQHAVFFAWQMLTKEEAPSEALIHRITFSDGHSIEGAGMGLRKRPIVLGPPLRGSEWLAANGPSNTAGHRRTIVALEGKARIPQRFAIDWIQTDAQGRAAVGDPKSNSSYIGYGAEVLAVGDGKISRVHDGMPENVPDPVARAVKITPDTAAGNFVILELGDERFVLYGHLQPGSLRVKVGDAVKRGQALGLLGNSGNSTAPHLHFQVADANAPLNAEGIPYVFESYEVQSMPGAPGEVRRGELPLNGQRIKFP